MNADQISSYLPEGKGSQQCAIQGSILIREIKGPMLEENLYDLDDAKFPSSYCSISYALTTTQPQILLNLPRPDKPVNPHTPATHPDAIPINERILSILIKFAR